MPLDICVLVASGDADVADDLLRRVSQLGCQALSVSRHAQALAATQDREFHLALVTETLEDGSGLEVVAALRRKHPRLAVYLLATTADERLWQAARDCGATRCVARPLSRVVMESWLEDAVEMNCPSSMSSFSRSAAMAAAPVGPAR